MKETRAEKAQRLVNEGRVEIVYNDRHAQEAIVQGDHGRYPVTVYISGRYFCPCDWGLYNSYTTNLCAHALAVKLAVEKENKPC